jgi:hypothetical protein
MLERAKKKDCGKPPILATKRETKDFSLIKKGLKLWIDFRKLC